jgi:hypothetical protein
MQYKLRCKNARLAFQQHLGTGENAIDHHNAEADKQAQKNDAHQ